MAVKVSRRSLIIGMASVLSSPRLALASGITLSPDPAGDDWAQITAAIYNLRSAGRGWIELSQPSSTPFNIKKSIDATGLTNADIRFSPGTVVRCDGFTGDGAGRSAPMFDCSNSWNFSITGEGNFAGLIQGLDASSPAGTVGPNCAILISNVDTKRVQDMNTGGNFSSCSIGIVCCSDIDIIGGAHSNYNTMAPVVVVSCNPDWWLWSPYSTFPAPNTFVNDIRFCARIHGLGHQPWSTYLRNANNIEFDHCLMDNNKRTQILAQGTNDGITVTSGKSYSELGAKLLGVVECQSPDACKNLKMIGFGTSGIPNTIGSGNFAGLNII